jgi:hypothetical protein
MGTTYKFTCTTEIYQRNLQSVWDLEILHWCCQAYLLSISCRQTCCGKASFPCSPYSISLITTKWIWQLIYHHHYHRRRGQNSPFWARAFIKKFCQTGLCLRIRPYGFHFSRFRNYFFAEQCRQPCVQSPSWRTGSLYVCPQWQDGPVVPQAQGCLSVAF